MLLLLRIIVAWGEGAASPKDAGYQDPWTDEDEADGVDEGKCCGGEGSRRRLGDGHECEGDRGERGLVHMRTTWS